MNTWFKFLVPVVLAGAVAACSDDPEPTAESNDTVDKFELEVDDDKVKVNVEEDSDDDG
ncbi:MAG: hypothetical protein ABF271_14010 [Abyssibacter sp.]|uniref:hypothetical protein n=1 Tax=Abyssibacter sp. TaxID=2320200 RepID=UPI003219B15C